MQNYIPVQSHGYSKYKDRLPQDTIFAVQKILNDAGLCPMTRWIEGSAYSGVRSNRVTLYPSSCGTNGKGTDKLYCAASGYAELMERVENGMLSFHVGLRRFLGSKHGFFDAPDEKRVTIADLIAEKNVFLKRIMNGFDLRNKQLQTKFLSALSKNFYGLTDETIPVIPFANLTSGKVQWLPSFFNFVIYGSNGMAAGNTIEEAMVQAFSEIFERHANKMLLTGKAVPPRIPDKYLQPYSLWNLVEQIRGKGKYDVAFYDCSLGKGYPVVACIICDKKSGLFGMRLGSHPSFAVAVERTLTEALQGRAKIDSFVSMCRAGSLEESTSFHNIPNIAKVGWGTYPATMLLNEPDWEFKAWTDWKDSDNKSFLKRMIKLLTDEGYSILLRDASFLGFPACQIIIPEMSDLYPVTPIWARAIYSCFKIIGAVPRFPKLTEQEEELLLRLIRFKENSAIENQLDAIFSFPVRGKRMNSDLVGGFLAFKQGKLQLAIHFFNKLYQLETDESEKIVLAARLEYLRYRLIGHTHEEASKLIFRFFLYAVAEQVIDEMSEPETVMERVFPQMNCPNCADCELKGKECDDAEWEIMDKIYSALKNGKEVSQEALLTYLKEFI